MENLTWLKSALEGVSILEKRISGHVRVVDVQYL